MYNIQFSDETLFNDAFDLNEPTQELFENYFETILSNNGSSSENEIEYFDEIIDYKKLTFEKNQQQQNQSKASKPTTHLVVIILLLLIKHFMF